jgi:hypothetical protein
LNWSLQGAEIFEKILNRYNRPFVDHEQKPDCAAGRAYGKYKTFCGKIQIKTQIRER